MEGFNLVKAALIERRQKLAALPQNCLPANKYEPYNRLVSMAMEWRQEHRPSMADLHNEFKASVGDMVQGHLFPSHMCFWGAWLVLQGSITAS